VRVIGLLSWYDEQPKWLAATIASLGKRIDLDHLVAVDGAYQLLPGGENESPPEQRETIMETCASMGIGLTLHVPETVWTGNEVEKRSAMFALGQLAAEEDKDWFMVMDADELLKACPSDIRERLNRSPLDAGQVTFLTRNKVQAHLAHQFQGEEVSRAQIPIFFRAVAGGIRVIGNHYTYVTADGRKLWGHGFDETSGELGQFLDLSDVEIDHRTEWRTQQRRKAQKDYYDLRDERQIEHTTCVDCDERGSHVVQVELAKNEDGSVEAWTVSACDVHYPELKRKRDRWLRENGIPAEQLDRMPAPVSA
jgi:hypothetical protein